MGTGPTVIWVGGHPRPPAGTSGGPRPQITIIRPAGIGRHCPPTPCSLSRGRRRTPTVPTTPKVASEQVVLEICTLTPGNTYVSAKRELRFSTAGGNHFKNLK